MDQKIDLGEGAYPLLKVVAGIKLEMLDGTQPQLERLEKIAARFPTITNLELSFNGKP